MTEFMEDWQPTSANGTAVERTHRHLGMRFALAAFAVAAVLFAGATASAADSAEREWYGGKVIGADAAAIGLFAGAGAADSAALASVAGGVYALGGPIVHIAHDRGQTAAGSLGLRVGLPLGTGLIGILASNLFLGAASGVVGAFDGLQWFAAGALVGAAGAMVIDWFVLSHRYVPTSSETVERGLQLRWDF